MSAFVVVLALHIAVGTVASVTGFVALFSRKGARLHRRAGALWVAAMTVLAASIVALGLLIASLADVVAGAFTLYLVLTAWLAVRRPAGTFGALDRTLSVIPLATGVLTLAGLYATMTAPGGPPADLPPGQQPPVAIAFAAVAFLAAALDGRVMFRRGLEGAARISRHIWRICLAMFFATGSFGAQVPVMLKRIDLGSPPLLVVFAPALLVLVLLAFWMIRVRLEARFKRSARQDERNLDRQEKPSWPEGLAYRTQKPGSEVL